MSTTRRKSGPRTRAGFAWKRVAIDWAIVVVLWGLALWLRWPLLDLGYTSDEIANVMVGSAAEIYADPEANVNPPLLRMLLNAALPDASVPGAGRWASMVWGLIAVAAAYGVGKAGAGGARLGGLLAGLLLATHPLAVLYSALFRAYAWWSGLALLHVWAMGKVLSRTPQQTWADGWGARRWVLLALATAVLLPWIHYMAVPLLLSFGAAVVVGMPGRRMWAAIYVPAALAISPMVPVVMQSGGRRTVPEALPDDVLAEAVAMDLTPPMALANVAAKSVKALGFTTFRWPIWMSIGLMALMIVHLLAWRWLNRTQRLLTVGALGVSWSLWGIAHVQNVRDPTTLMVVSLLGPLALCWAPGLGQRWASVRPVGAVSWAKRIGLVTFRTAATVAMAWWVFDAVPDRLAYHVDRAQMHNGLPDVVGRLPAFDVARGEGEVVIHPSYLVPSVWFYLTNTQFRRAPHEGRCQGYGACFAWQNRLIRGEDRVGDGGQLTGVLMSFEQRLPDGFASACTPLEQRPGGFVFACGGSGTPDP